MSANGEYVVYFGYILSREEVKTMRSEIERMFGHSGDDGNVPEYAR